MLVYLLVGISVPLWAILSTNYKKNRNHVFFLVLCGIELVLVSGLRGDFCADYYSYYSFFEKINRDYSFKSILQGSFYNEKGFVLFNKGVGIFSDAPEFFMFIWSLLLVFSILYVIGKYSECAWMSVLLFVGVGLFYDSFNVTRQVFAAAIYFLGARFLFEKKFWKYCIVVLVASTFHRTALLYIPIYFFLTSKITRKSLTIYVPLAGATFIFLPHIIELARIIFPAYRNHTTSLGHGSINWIVVPSALLLFVLISFGFSKVDRHFIDDRITQVSLNALILYVFFTALGIQVQLVARLATYVQPFSWILIPNLLIHYKNTQEKRLLILLVTVLAILYPLITLSGTGYDPYYSILS